MQKLNHKVLVLSFLVCLSATAQCRLVFDGNSLVAGAYLKDPSTEGFPAQTMALLKSEGFKFDPAVNGVSFGITTPMMISNTTTLIDKYAPAILVFWEGGNDIEIGGADGPTAYAHIVSYAKGQKQKGFKVIVLTVPDRANWSQAPLREKAREYVNAQLKAHWREFADGLVDANVLGKTNFIDGVHMTRAGYTIVAGNAAKEIARLGANCKP